MEERRSTGLLHADFSALTQYNRCGEPLRQLLMREDLHPWLVHGSDYPLPAINALIRTGTLEDLGYITSDERRVLNELGTDIAAIKRELECYVTGRPRRRGARWKRPATAGRACSFCGRSEKIAGRLVAGPGVHICGGCVALATDILRREAA